MDNAITRQKKYIYLLYTFLTSHTLQNAKIAFVKFHYYILYPAKKKKHFSTSRIYKYYISWMRTKIIVIIRYLLFLLGNSNRRQVRICMLMYPVKLVQNFQLKKRSRHNVKSDFFQIQLFIQFVFTVTLIPEVY